MNHAQQTLGEILVVDDNPDALTLMSALLEDAGYTVRLACSGAQALWAAVVHQPDLILLDVRMPGMNGLEACRCLKQHPLTASIPIIILSAADSPADRIAGFEAGAADFIGKPFDDREVLARAKTHVDMALVRKKVLWRHKLGRVETGLPKRTVSDRKEILIVEDTPESLQLLAEILTGAGFVVREAPNGELALWSATKHPPDLVLLDIRMPGMNGIDVCLALKVDQATTRIPVIFISALSDPLTKEEGFKAGAVDFITKPFDETEVLARVNTHLRLMETTYQPVPDTQAADRQTTLQQDIGEIYSYSACAILLVDAKGQVTYANPSFVRLAGYALDNAEGIDLGRVFERGNILSPAGSPAACGCRSGENTINTKEGDRIPCRISQSAVIDEKGNSVHIVALEDMREKSLGPVVVESLALHEFASFSTSHSALPALETSLHGALQREEFFLVYQPIFDLATRRLAGAEALLRWQHPRFGTLLPYQFLLAAEETGEIIPVGKWVIDSACKQIKAWLGAPLPTGFRLAINIDFLQFWQDNLVETIERALSDNDLMAESVELDVSVETLAEDLTQGIAVLHRLKNLGVMLALDRYGHGSLPPEVLARLPLDTLKIDPMPILSMNNDPASQEAVRNMIELAHAMRLRVVANGIEQQWHLALVQSGHCDLGQGYLLGAPLPANQFLEEHLRAGQ